MRKTAVVPKLYNSLIPLANEQQEGVILDVHTDLGGLKHLVGDDQKVKL